MTSLAGRARVSIGQVADAVVGRASRDMGPDGARRPGRDPAAAAGLSRSSRPAASAERAPVAAPAPPGRRRPASRARRLAMRKPDWLRVPARMGEEYRALGRTMASLSLVTVCEEAGCPNIYECWADGTATFMVNGSRCTRACGFCQVDTRHPLPLDPAEPERVAEAVERMDLAHAVVTCVARDDLADGGAGAIAATVAAIRRRRPGHHRRDADLGLQGGRRRARRSSSSPAGRPQPQHRDRGPAPAGGAAVRRLRPEPRRCWPGRPTPAWWSSPG